jgi:hypothetical protein
MPLCAAAPARLQNKKPHRTAKGLQSNEKSFRHPDYRRAASRAYTVGTGFQPVLPGLPTRLADSWLAPFTAGGESHPAPKL